MTKLFNDFQEISAKEWKQKIQVDLKGADYNQTLIWQSLEGISVKPFYHSDDDIPQHPINYNAANWKIGQNIYVADETSANQKALNCIEKGADSLLFIIPNDEVDLNKLLNTIEQKEIEINIKPLMISKKLIKALSAIKDASYYRLHLDIIGNLCRSGNWFDNLKQDHEILELAVQKLRHFKSVISIDASLYQNAGANMVQQLAYSLAHANEYLNHFQQEEQLNLVVNISVGSNYFFEIAKLRTFRLLFDAVLTEYKTSSELHITATPSKRNKTIYDYNTNMLRTTTECMSAILGGADSIYNLPYDAIYHKSNDFGDRIARNQLLVLKHESYFQDVENPVDGSYYVEALTNAFAEKALELFKDIEKNGGFSKMLKEGTIQRKTKESANKEQELFDSHQISLIGTNEHPNKADKMSQELELYPFVKTNKRKTLIEPIIEKRLSEAIEQERLKTEQTNYEN